MAGGSTNFYVHTKLYTLILTFRFSVILRFSVDNGLYAWRIPLLNCRGINNNWAKLELVGRWPFIRTQVTANELLGSRVCARLTRAHALALGSCYLLSA